ncbi:MAG: winged helix-turn-helix domain-containing protein [Pleomorphochaeta sp.]
MKIPKTLKNNSDIEIRVRFSCDNIYFGPGAAQLLELIEKGESVREACKLMKMSYSKGWKILNMIKDETGYDAVIRHQGGANGGKTELSEEGIALLNSFRTIEKEIKEYAKERYSFYIGCDND